MVVLRLPGDFKPALYGLAGPSVYAQPQKGIAHLCRFSPRPMRGRTTYGHASCSFPFARFRCKKRCAFRFGCHPARAGSFRQKCMAASDFGHGKMPRTILSPRVISFAIFLPDDSSAISCRWSRPRVSAADSPGISACGRAAGSARALIFRFFHHSAEVRPESKKPDASLQFRLFLFHPAGRRSHGGGTPPRSYPVPARCIRHFCAGSDSENRPACARAFWRRDDSPPGETPERTSRCQSGG